MPKNPNANPMFFSKHYEDTCDAVSNAIADWFETHPGADPQFEFPPEGMLVSGDLPIGLTYWEPNADGRELVTYVEQATERFGASMLQFQVCFGHYKQHGRKLDA
jgi:hypothetical protein